MSNIISKALKRVIAHNALRAALLCAAVLGVVALSLVPPQILRVIVDKKLMIHETNGLLLLGLMYLLAIGAVGVLDFVKEWILTDLGQKLIADVRMSMVEKIKRINITYFTENSPASAASRIINDVETINTLFTSGVISMVIDCFKILGIVVSIWIFSKTLGILTLVVFPVIFLITRRFQGKMLASQIENRRVVGNLNEHFAQSLTNADMIKAFGKEEYMEEIFKGQIEKNYSTLERVNFYDALYSPVVMVLRGAVIGAVAVLSAPALGWTGISAGALAASIELISNLFSPAESLGTELQNIQTAVSGIVRINEFCGEAEEKPKDLELTYNKLFENNEDFDIKFSRVSFSYDSSHVVLKDIDIEIKRGERVVFAGRTGVGKSTIFRLITGLLEPTEGSITINGEDVFKIPNEEKRKIFGIVEQGFKFAEGSIKEQISLKDESITDEDVENAMKFVGLHDIVLAMPNGYDTICINQGLFSQGQLELLSIARAIVSKPKILLLDEITANLDSMTEKEILSVLQKAGEGRITLSVSHRLGAIDQDSNIYVLENGEISAFGTKSRLLKENEWFRRQMRAEEEG